MGQVIFLITCRVMRLLHAYLSQCRRLGRQTLHAHDKLHVSFAQYDTLAMHNYPSDISRCHQAHLRRSDGTCTPAQPNRRLEKMRTQSGGAGSQHPNACDHCHSKAGAMMRLKTISSWNDL